MSTTEVTINKALSDPGRIVIFVIGCILKICGAYLVSAMICYQVKFAQQQKKQFKEAALKSIKKKVSSGHLNELSLATAICGFFTCSFDPPTLSMNPQTDTVCKVLQTLSFISYASGMVSLYLFLWMRQRACYKNKSLRRLYSRFTIYLSFLILPIFLTLMVAGMVMTAALWDFESSDEGCIEESKSPIPLICLYIGSVSIQSVLLILFLRPLKEHVSMNPKKLFQNRKSQSPDPSDRFQQLIKRCVISTGLCVLSDTICFIIVMPLFKQVPFIVINYMYDIDLLLNIIFINGSFADWKIRLAPWVSDFTIKDKNADYISSLSSSKAIGSIVRKNTCKVDDGTSIRLTELVDSNDMLATDA